MLLGWPASLIKLFFNNLNILIAKWNTGIRVKFSCGTSHPQTPSSGTGLRRPVYRFPVVSLLLSLSLSPSLFSSREVDVSGGGLSLIFILISFPPHDLPFPILVILDQRPIIRIINIFIIATTSILAILASRTAIREWRLSPNRFPLPRSSSAPPPPTRPSSPSSPAISPPLLSSRERRGPGVAAPSEEDSVGGSGLRVPWGPSSTSTSPTPPSRLHPTSLRGSWDGRTMIVGRRYSVFDLVHLDDLFALKSWTFRVNMFFNSLYDYLAVRLHKFEFFSSYS